MNENKLERAAFNELLFNYAMIPVKGHFHPTLADLSYDTNAMINMFKKGAFWQEDQSPWISAKKLLQWINRYFLNMEMVELTTWS